jgi:hypothetical protein
VILTDVLAFDVRVFDPMAPLVATANGEVLVPSDPGYTTQVNLINAGNATGSIAGFGAFVDMGYNGVVPYPTSLVSVTAPPNVTPTPAPLLASQFCNYPNAVSTLLSAPTMSNPYTVSQATYFNANAQLMPQTYDTFSLGVEQNNFDEDEGNVAAGAPGVGMVDQGSDGLDDDQTATAGTSKPDGIVDNVPQVSAPYLVSSGTAKPSVVEGYASSGERETMAPYPFPLRGVQVILRVYEPDTRQVRQVTIVQDFLPD